jgi:hypothetical protein
VYVIANAMGHGDDGVEDPYPTFVAGKVITIWIVSLVIIYISTIFIDLYISIYCDN